MSGLPRLGHRPLSVTAAVVVLGLLLAAFVSPVAPARGDDPPHVTLIGDSVPDALNWPPANVIASQGIDLDLETTSCRRTEDVSCFGEDGTTRPPTLIQLVQSLGSSLGPTVVVMIGYNDYDNAYRGVVGDALDALDQAGVKRILWLNLREAREPYVSMNAAIESWEPSHPELTVLDWNAYSRSHLDWFQDDGLHLVPDGAIGLGTFIHSELSDLGIALPPPAPPPPAGTTGTVTTTASPPPVRIVSSKLPAAAEGEPYLVQLVAGGGSPPYRWQAVTKLPHGFGLAHDGLMTGIPRSALGVFAVTVRVTDDAGDRVARRLVLNVDR